MNYKAFMIKVLNGMIGGGERLRFMFYGTVMNDKKKPRFGFFGATKKYFLVALMDESQRKIADSQKIALDIRKAVVKKSLFPGQFTVDLEFESGEIYNLRVAKKIMNIDCQEENIKAFLEFLEKRNKELQQV